MEVKQQARDLLAKQFIENLYRLYPGEEYTDGYKVYVKVPGGWVCESIHTKNHETVASCFIPFVELPEREPK